MYSYHIVAELRQFRGALAATDRRIHMPLFWQTSLAKPLIDSVPLGPQFDIYSKRYPLKGFFFDRIWQTAQWYQ